MKRFSIKVSRRSFLKSAAAMAAVPLWYAEETFALSQTQTPKSANDKPGIALIGCGGQGRGDCNVASHFGNIVAVCDLDENRLNQAAEQFKAKNKFKDFRKLLECKDVDIVITGTPDHWHTMVNIAASNAGKDIYSEKPLTLTIAEGKKLVEVIRKNKTILQVGSQQRSEQNFRFACELVRNGRIGKLKNILVGLPTGPREGPFAPEPVPDCLDWDFYQGQTGPRDYTFKRTHYEFRWWYDYSGGQLTDWGAHHNDIAQWGNGTELSGPVEFDGRALGKPMIEGGYTAAAEFHIEAKYANGVTMTTTNRAPCGIRFEGTEGWVYVERGGTKYSHPELEEVKFDDSKDIRLYRSNHHMGNFIECVKNRKDPVCTVEIGHRSISVAHLNVISARLGRKIKWDPVAEAIIGDKEAEAMLSRPMRKPYNYSFIGL